MAVDTVIGCFFAFIIGGFLGFLIMGLMTASGRQSDYEEAYNQGKEDALKEIEKKS